MNSEAVWCVSNKPQLQLKLAQRFSKLAAPSSCGGVLKNPLKVLMDSPYEGPSGPPETVIPEHHSAGHCCTSWREGQRKAPAGCPAPTPPAAPVAEALDAKSHEHRPATPQHPLCPVGEPGRAFSSLPPLSLLRSLGLSFCNKQAGPRPSPEVKAGHRPASSHRTSPPKQHPKPSSSSFRHETHFQNSILH